MAGLKDFVDEIAEATQAEYLAEETKDDTGFVTKDSGERLKFESGMQRDVETGKKDYSLCLSGPMFERWAALLTRGAIKYERNNWMKARGNAEEERFIRSAFRHFVQWINGEKDEDHGAAVFFNINGAEYVRGLRAKEDKKDEIEPTDPVEREKFLFLKKSGVNRVPFVDIYKGHTGPHPPTSVLDHPSKCQYCRPEEAVDKRMAQDGTAFDPEFIDPAKLMNYKSKLANGYRVVFYWQHGLYYVKVFDAETSQLLEEGRFHFLHDANLSYNRERENDQ
jgi:hypothetical protein